MNTIKHIVMWKVAGDSPSARADAAQRVKRAFEGLRGRIPGMRHVEVGVDTSAEAHACDVVLYTEFDSADSLAAYAEHPEHLRVSQSLAGVRTSRHQVDYAVQHAEEACA